MYQYPSGGPYAFEIYRYSKMALDPEMPWTRYEAPKRALGLLACHAAQFAPYMMDDYQVLYSRLKFWSSHKNYELLHEGVAAMESFYKEVSDIRAFTQFVRDP